MGNEEYYDEDLELDGKDVNDFVGEMIEYVIPNLIKMERSEEIASEVFKSYDMEYVYLNEDLKEKYRNIIKFGRELGIEIKPELYETVVDKNDVIERIAEQKYYQLDVLENEYMTKYENSYDTELEFEMIMRRRELLNTFNSMEKEVKRDIFQKEDKSLKLRID